MSKLDDEAWTSGSLLHCSRGRVATLALSIRSHVTSIMNCTVGPCNMPRMQPRNSKAGYKTHGEGFIRSQ